MQPNLTLEARVDNQLIRAVFTQAGGTIGRVQPSDLLLPGHFVSRRHARITFDEWSSIFYIEDTGANGVVLNGYRLESGQRYPLLDGDTIAIDRYEISVRVVGGQTFERRPGTIEIQRPSRPDAAAAPIPGFDLRAGDSAPAAPKARQATTDASVPSSPAGESVRAPRSAAPPKGPKKNVAPKKGRVTAWFGTNRLLQRTEGQLTFSSARGDRIHFGRCSVSVPKSHVIGSIGSPWWKRLLTLTDDRLRIRRTIILAEHQFWDQMNARLNRLATEERHAVVFIHGYNVSFEDAAIRAAQLGYDLNVPGVMAFFSWPSSGTIHGYVSDEASIEASEGHITEFLTSMAIRSGATRFHLIAHSMGNRAVLRAVDRIATSATSRSNALFDQVILAAPDVDQDTFRRLSAAYQRVAKWTTLYVCSKDIAVEASRWIHQYPRAGLVPPVTIVPGIDTVNVSSLDLTRLGHGYVAEARELLSDIHTLITRGVHPDQRFSLRRVFTPEGAFWTVGR